MKLLSIASTTHLDRHYTRISKQLLESAAQQTNGTSCPAYGLAHDISLPPLGKTLEAQVEPTDDGEHQLVIIQEIFEKESILMFPDNTLLVKRESETDRRPFITGMEPSAKTQIAFGPVNFGSKSNVLEFVRSIEETVGKGFVAETHLIRKSAIPDPELVFTISEAIIAYLLGKKIIEKVGDKVFSQVADDLANFYSLVKTASRQMAKYAIPKNRPITYVFNAPGTPNIELVAITNNPNLLDTALDETKLRAVFSNADNYRSLLSAEKVQYLLNLEGEWEFNYLLTEDGAVIGTVASFDKQARIFNLMFSKDNGEQSSVSGDESTDSESAKKLLVIYRRRLHKLKEKQALYGRSVDPQVLIEIEDLEAKIESLESEL